MQEGSVDVSLDRSGEAVIAEGNRVRLPSRPGSAVVFGDVVVFRVRPPESPNPDADLQLPAPHRNVVAFDADGTHRWTVEAPEDDEPRQYIDVCRFFDRCFLRRVSPDGRDAAAKWVEIDPHTGSVVESFPRGSVRIGGELVEFDPPARFHTFGDDLAVVTEAADEYFEHYGTAFDRSENQLWRSKLVSTRLREEDGLLVAQYEARMGGYVAVGYDPRTGEPAKLVRTAFSEEEHIRNHLPPELRHLVDDYLSSESNGD